MTLSIEEKRIRKQIANKKYYQSIKEKIKDTEIPKLPENEKIQQNIVGPNIIWNQIIPKLGSVGLSVCFSLVSIYIKRYLNSSIKSKEPEPNTNEQQNNCSVSWNISNLY